MAITIKRGSTEDARRELTAYYLAYQCMTIQDSAETVTVWTFDAGSLPVWADMQHNTVTDVKTGPAAIAAIMAA